MPREVALAQVQRYAREIVPAFNAYMYFRVGYWVGKKLSQSLYRVRIGYTDDAGLAAIPENATVVFVMNHRSNMDYIIASYLAAERAALSYAVGEWARLWGLQQLIRTMGAYFVRRNSKDDLYRRVLERYIAMATEAGVTQAVYPEGGLTQGRLPARAAFRRARLHAARLPHPRRARPGVRAARAQLRPRARRPHAVAGRRRAGAPAGALARAVQHARLRRQSDRAAAAQPLAPPRLCLRQLRHAGVGARLGCRARHRLRPARQGTAPRRGGGARPPSDGRGRPLDPGVAGAAGGHRAAGRAAARVQPARPEGCGQPARANRSKAAARGFTCRGTTGTMQSMPACVC